MKSYDWCPALDSQEQERELCIQCFPGGNCNLNYSDCNLLIIAISWGIADNLKYQGFTDTGTECSVYKTSLSLASHKIFLKLFYSNCSRFNLKISIRDFKSRIKIAKLPLVNQLPCYAQQCPQALAADTR